MSVSRNTLALGAWTLLHFGAAVADFTPTASIPAQAQVIDQRTFNVLSSVLTSTELNGATGLFIPPGTDSTSLLEKPFHVYDDDFYSIIGNDPTLTLIAEDASNPLFHEAVIWHNAADEMFFTQASGSKAAGTGLTKSGIIQKISLASLAGLTSLRNASGQVTVETVPSNPEVVNPNGGTNYKGNLLYVGQGQGDAEPRIYIMNPVAPYNTTVLLNNFMGHQFNSLNDIAVNRKNLDLYFTDPNYGFVQGFRPTTGLPTQVYRFNDVTGAVTVVADGFVEPNGIAFSHDGSIAYVTDSGMQSAQGFNASLPSTIYRFNVADDGSLQNRQVFAYVEHGLPDGIKTDTNGNVYVGCGDGIRVWNPSGKLLGKIYLGATSANFQFAGDGRMVICADTALYYATLNATGSFIDEYL